MNRKEILEKLDKLRSIDAKFKVFGSEYHKYHLNPPISEKKIIQFERKYKITLPIEYKTFLMEIGNGGAGPYYGVFPLGKYDDGAWIEGQSLVGILSKPFPYSSDWNKPPRLPNEEDYEDEELFDKDYQAAVDEYWKPIDGAIPICHQGCSLRYWLIVSGPETGKIWLDKLAEFSGLKKTTQNFEEWYIAWLEDSLQKVRSL